MQALRSRPGSSLSSRRSGITLMELLLVIAIGVQTIGLLLPAVQRLQQASEVLEFYSGWIELNSVTQTVTRAIEVLGEDTLAAVRIAVRERDIDREVFGDLMSRHTELIDEVSRLQGDFEAAIEVETDPGADAALRGVLNALIAAERALQANQDDLERLLGTPIR